MDNLELAEMYPRKLDSIKKYGLWDEMVLYSPVREQAFSLNSSAKVIWELCNGQRTVAEICQELGQNFDAAEADLMEDVEATVNQLHQAGLLALEEASAPESG
jgi:coenzyme PQQ biosynthesis protein PqqD